ncbi:Por secretion system C-terminal sorting domain-containing protein [Flavobacteriaceae bacterium MAR_2010_188]|nr:Por secretion system C-terminal sorting domain-containing protein [Flavobacteriaceae bacterium MAR_2010_188]
MNKFFISTLILFLFIGIQSFGQKSYSTENLKRSEDGIIRCLTDQNTEYLQKRNPDYKKIKNLQEKISKQRNLKVSGVAEVIRIPVVVHVINNGEAIGSGTNISDAQVISQIRVLNEDFRRISGTRGFNTHPDGADTEIEFYLAKEDPNCNPTTGIDRINLSNLSTSWSGPGGNTDNVLKPQTIWDSNRYMNIWTVKFSDNDNLGFAQFPGGSDTTDGIVISYDSFGSIDTAGVVLSPPYNLGRTTTHEVGHYFGLYHTFNGKSCTGTGDFADDTPPTNVENYGCPTTIPDSCPGGDDDMIENYMDYSDDICMNIFTNDQAAIMRSYLDDQEFRLTLANSNISDTPPSEIQFDTSVTLLNLNTDNCIGEITPKIKLANYGTSTLTSTTILYQINGGVVQEYNWSGSLAQNQSTIISLPTQNPPEGDNVFLVKLDRDSSDDRDCNNEDANNFEITPAYQNINQIVFTLLTDDYSEETSWELKDSSGTILYSDSYNSGADNNKLFTETFNIAQDQCYTFTIYDSESDGICCTYGEGYYQLATPAGAIIKRGGEFAGIETTTISTIERVVDPGTSNEKIRIYPNPTLINFKIDLVSGEKLPKNYQIFNSLGQLMLDAKIQTEDDLIVNTVALSNGIYFLRIYRTDKTTVIPFIKK